MKFNDDFRAIKDAMTAFEVDSKRITEAFKMAKESNAARYQPEVAAQQTEMKRKDCYAAIDNAHKQLKSSVYYHISNIRKAFSEWTNTPPQKAFMDKLTNYSNFGVKLSESELIALLNEAEGNYQALRCLDAVSHKSGFYLDGIATMETLESDLSKLENAAEQARYAVEGSDSNVLPLLPKTYTWRNLERPVSGMYATLKVAEIESTIKGIDAICQRWNDSVSLSKAAVVRKAEAIKKENPDADISELMPKTSESIKVESSELPEMIAQNIAAERRAAEVRRYYTRQSEAE